MFRLNTTDTICAIDTRINSISNHLKEIDIYNISSINGIENNRLYELSHLLSTINIIKNNRLVYNSILDYNREYSIFKRELYLFNEEKKEVLHIQNINIDKFVSLVKKLNTLIKYFDQYMILSYVKICMLLDESIQNIYKTNITPDKHSDSITNYFNIYYFDKIFDIDKKKSFVETMCECGEPFEIKYDKKVCNICGNVKINDIDPDDDIMEKKVTTSKSNPSTNQIKELNILLDSIQGKIILEDHPSYKVEELLTFLYDRNTGGHCSSFKMFCDKFKSVLKSGIINSKVSGKSVSTHYQIHLPVIYDMFRKKMGLTPVKFEVLDSETEFKLHNLIEFLVNNFKDYANVLDTKVSSSNNKASTLSKSFYLEKLIRWVLLESNPSAATNEQYDRYNRLSCFILQKSETSTNKHENTWKVVKKRMGEVLANPSLLNC
jgi:hypothetical protein